MYGIINTKKNEISKELMILCLRLAKNFSDKENRIYFLLFIMAMETDLGNYPDTYEAQGKGIFQTDSPWFENVYKRYTTESNKAKTLNKINKEFGVELKNIKFEELDFSITINGIITVLGLLLIPERLPSPNQTADVLNYYKRHYNSFSGKATTDLSKIDNKLKMIKEVYEDCLDRKVNNLFNDLKNITSELQQKLL